MNDLTYLNINSRQKVVIDPDNVFWGITDNPFIPQEILSLYAKVRDRLSLDFNNFRFGAELSAIYIDPTDKCNANCPYCYIPLKMRKRGRSLTKKELFFILEKIGEYFRGSKRKCVIVFHASEPLLLKEIIFETIKEYKDKFNFGLQTNAILLERQDVEFLKKYRVGVGISLDSSSSSVNNRLRPYAGEGGNFDKAISAIEWFDGYVGLNVITTVTKLNVIGLPRMVKFLHAKKVPCVLFNPMRLTQKSSRSLKPDEKLLTQYFIKAIDTAIELSKQSKRRIIIGNFTNVILGIVAPNARRLMCDISPCGGGRCFLTITAKGEMIPCGEFIGLRGFSGGNIFKTSIEEAMQSRPFKKLRERFVEKISECKVCIFRNICGAPCPAELYSLGNMYPVRSKSPKATAPPTAETSNGMYQKSVFCKFYKEIIGYAIKLIAEGKVKYCFREEGLKNLEYEYSLGAKR